MTKVVLHGILGKEFKKTFNFLIKRPKDVFEAISCSHSNFRHRVTELAKQGIHFTLLMDGKKMNSNEEFSQDINAERIDIVPLILGAGDSLNEIVGAVLIVIGTVISFMGNPQIGIPIAMAGLQIMLMPDPPKLPRPQADVSAAKQSFIFSSKANTTEQGIPVPVGYGRLRVGSAVIQSTVKSYPQSFSKETSLGVTINGQKRINDTSNV